MVFSVSPWALLGLLILFYAFARALPQPSFSHGAKEISVKGALSHLLRNKAYLVFVAVYFFVFFSESTLAFYPVLVSAVGGTTAHYGLSVFLYGSFEALVIFFYTKFLKKFGGVGVLYLGIIGTIIRCVMYSLVNNVTTAMIFSVFQAITFALFFPAMNTCMLEIVDRKYLSTAFMAITAVSTGIGVIIGSTLWGAIAGAYGVQRMYLFAAIPGVLSIAVLFIFRKVIKGGKLKETGVNP